MDDLIIPSLPQEIGRECLLRVPYKSHHVVKSVCKKWRDVVSSPCFHQDRKLLGMREYCICLSMIQTTKDGNKWLHGHSTDSRRIVSVYDPLKGSWESLILPPIPDFPDNAGIPHFSHFVSVKGKLILMGGWHPTTWKSLTTVFIYDFSSGLWRRRSDMPTVRSMFACSASPDGLIYVAGGHDDDKNALRGAAVYNVEEDRWEDLGSMIQARDECHGVFVHGKWWVISGYATGSQGQFEKSVQVFNPKTGIWSMVENMWTLGGCPRFHTCVSGCGKLYSFQQGRVMRYEAGRNVWAAVGYVPESVDVVNCAAACYDGILVSARAAYDKGHAQNQNGNDDIWYTYKPSTGEWTTLERPQNFQGFVQSATAVEM